LKDASPEEILRAVRAVRDGEGILHPGLVGRVIREFARSKLEQQGEQRFSELTPREREVLDLLAEGLRNQDIAGRLSIAEKTVKHHISSILSKLQLNHRTEAALLASRSGLGRRNAPR
jgi:DNA-binding NarL/FixJ family response regulator